MIAKKKFLNLKFSRPKAKAAGTEQIRQVMTTLVEMMMEFSPYLAKLASRQASGKFEIRNCFGHHTGGFASASIVVLNYEIIM